MPEKTLQEIEFEKFIKPKDNADHLRVCVPHIPLPKTEVGQVDWKSVESWPVVMKFLRIRSHNQEEAEQQQSTNDNYFFNNEINAQLDCRHHNILPLLGFQFHIKNIKCLLFL